MAYKIKATFPEGITQDDVAKVTKEIGLTPDNPPEGNISHRELVEGGRVVIIDEFESREAFEAFLNERVAPAHSKTGVPLPEIEEL